ncbi:MAG TPA: hypothetical protein VLM80_03465 [Anaerolineales bacterium]|nr:hypothetical protein [Anaerolineales bacterium]
MIRRSTWIVLLVFLVVLAGFLYMQRSSQGEEIEIPPTSSSQKLFELAESDLASVTIQGSDGNTVVLNRSEEGEWVLAQGPSGETDVAAIQSALGQILNAQIVSSPGSLPGLEALNLENALFKILLIGQDGNQILINIGKETPTGSGYYVLTSNQRQVVVVNKFGIDALLNFLVNPPLMPTPTAEVEMTEGIEQTAVP